MPLRRSSLLRIGLLGVGWLLSLVLSACSSDLPQSTLNPKTENALAVYRLFEPIFWTAVVVFVIVEALLIYSVFRFRARGNANAIPQQLHGNTPLEIGWTIAPAVVLGIIFLLTAQTLNAVTEPPKGGPTLNVKVYGHQWWWEFQYPDFKTSEGKSVTTASDLHVPAGATVNYTLESVDVIHSFWVPQLGGKTDLIPGHINRGFFVAPKGSTEPFGGQCAEFCGTQHAQMRFHVIVDGDADFQAWVKGQQTLPAAPTGEAKDGAALLLKSGCVACHTIGGTKEAVGVLGPNLTHFGSRTTIAAGVLPNTPQNLSKWLRDPAAVKEGNDMAATMSSIVKGWGGDADKNIQLLVAYLESLK